MKRKNDMKTIKVVAAVIRDRDKIFATQKGYGEFKGGWEFPGGKIEEGETPQEALKREIMEELDTEIEVGELIDTIEYDYPDFHLSMGCYWCSVIRGDLVLKEHEAARWLGRDELMVFKCWRGIVGLFIKLRKNFLENIFCVVYNFKRRTYVSTQKRKIKEVDCIK